MGNLLGIQLLHQRKLSRRIQRKRLGDGMRIRSKECEDVLLVRVLESSELARATSSSKRSCSDQS